MSESGEVRAFVVATRERKPQATWTQIITMGCFGGDNERDNQKLEGSPDFQVGLGYDVEPPGEGNMAVGSNAVAERYNALSVTLEMPFKDTLTPAEAADPVRGWSPGRAKAFGAALGAALLDAAPTIAAARGKKLH